MLYERSFRRSRNIADPFGEFAERLTNVRSARSDPGDASSSRRVRVMVMNMVMKPRATVPAQISAAEFKATCLDLMDEVERTGSSVVVTKRGRAVARLAPVRMRVRSAFGLLKGRIAIRGNIVEPIEVRWNATR